MELEALGEQLYPLDRAQTRTRTELERSTDVLEQLLSESITTISTVYNLATAALEPSRSRSQTVQNASSALLECSEFVASYDAAFARVEAPSDYAERPAADSRTLSEANRKQEAARVAAEEASQALFACRGRIYTSCKRTYSAGRTAFRSAPELKAQFAFRYMIRSSSTKATSTPASAPSASAPSASAPSTSTSSAPAPSASAPSA